MRFDKNLHLQESKERKERWAHLTEGIRDDYNRIVVENLLENTKAWIEEATTTQNIGTFTTYAFPLIRRVFPSLIANELVSVQPMTMPTGLVFFLDHKYSNGVAPTVAGDDMEDIYNGKFNPYYATGARGEIPTGAVNGTNKDFATKFKPIKNLVVYVNSVQATVSSVNNLTGEFTLQTAPANGATVTVDYDFDFEGQDNAPEIEFSISSTTVTAEQKRLKAKWTLEAQQDLMAYHGIDAEAELLQLLGDEIRREIDELIVRDLFNNAGHNVNWSATYNSSSGYTKAEYDATIFNAILDASNVIYKKRLVKPNWMVVSPDVATRIEKLNSFKYDGDTAGGQIVKGLNVYGTLQGKFKVYVDPMAPSNKILLGYKGNNFLEAGYVYAPYIPLYVTPVITDTDFTPRRAVMSRFAKKLISPDFYATVTITA